MKRLLLGTMLLALVITIPVSVMADVNISIGIAADIGREKENGTWKTIDLFHHKDNLSFSNPESSSTDGLRVSTNIPNLKKT